MRIEDGQSGVGGFAMQYPETGNGRSEFEIHVDAFVDAAKKDAFERTNGTPDAIKRAETAIENRFRPYVIENLILADQISTPEFEEMLEATDDYLEGRVAAVQCDDGRITAAQIGDPRLISVGKRLKGMPEVRLSGKNNGQMVIRDSDINTSIKQYIDRQGRKGNADSHITELIGPHIFSTHPLHGCGKRMAEIAASGGTPEVEMWDGGINNYFDELDDAKFEAFNNRIRDLGGKGTTFDMVHDAYSQGLIFGLREARHNFDRGLSLRDNLETLSANGEILMTEKLDDVFQGMILARAKEMGANALLDLDNIYEFGRNAILIGTIARELTKAEEATGFEWIPEHLKRDTDPRAVRALGYVAMRNSVRRILGNIVPGEHNLVDHTEQSIAIGPIRGDYNKNTIPFIHHIRSGGVDQDELNNVQALLGLLKNSLGNYHQADPREEGRLVMTTGVFKRNIYATEEDAAEEFEDVYSVVGEDAAKIRERFSESVKNGEIVVLGCIHENKTRRIISLAN